MDCGRAQPPPSQPDGAADPASVQQPPDGDSTHHVAVDGICALPAPQGDDVPGVEPTRADARATGRAVAYLCYQLAISHE